MSQTMEYKGYSGCVLYSADDKVLHGRVIGIRDAITYEGTNVRSLEKNFRAAIHEYLRFCATENKPLFAR
jgi:predicted HicB family RNase H-like nuclease